MEFLSWTLIFMMLLGIGRSSVPLTLPVGARNVSEFFQTSCTPSGWKNYTDPNVRSCSQKCSCQPNCHEVGTCCPDMPGIDGLKPKYECRDIAEFYHVQPDHNILKADVHYRVVDDCPNDTMSKEYPRCVNAIYLDDFIIVSDLQDERLYRNHHCAMCHGVSEYVSWKAEVQFCDEIMYERFSSFEERDQYILANCAVISEPPQAGIGEMSRCFGDYSSNRYCQYSAITSTIKSLCSAPRPTTSTMFFVDQVLYNKILKTYPNIFCYFCEIGTVTVGVNCTLKTSPDSEVRNPPQNNLRALLKGSEELPEVRRDDDKCTMTTIWDPYIASCRPIFCPLGTIQSSKQCQPVFQVVQGVALSLFVSISVPPNYVSQIQPISYLVDTILQDMVSQEGVDCGLCDRWFSQIESEVVLEFPSFSTNKCTVSDIFAKARYLISNGTIGFQMKIDEETVNISFKVVTHQIGKVKYKSTAMISGKECSTRKQMVDWMFLDCPHFRIESDSLKTLGIDYDVQKNLTQQMVMTKIYNSSDVAICINDYFSSRRQRKNSANSAKKKKYAAYGLLLLIFLLAYSS